MHWKFRKVRDDEVEADITQRDQFSNDDVDLVDTLGREATQNSVDALNSEGGSQCVRLVFSFVEDVDPDYFSSLFKGLHDHLKSSEVDMGEIDWDNPRALIIEDFGTVGLTGSYESRDNGNFCDFWRRHGLSNKSGRSSGRWGLGKLVYTSSSLLRTFFGFTVRHNDNAELLMGQAVLSNHTINGDKYAPHGFFALQPENIQLPFTDPKFLSEFKTKLRLQRQEGQAGLSLVIPFPAPVIQSKSLLEVLILNYFFPILSGDLVVEVSGEVIDKTNIREMTEKYAVNKITDSEELFDFIKAVHNFGSDNLIKAKQHWHNSGKMSESSFIPQDLEEMREKFSEGQLIGIRLPIAITKDGTEERTDFDVFIQKPEILTSGRDMYVRGSITIPRESKFSHRKALGVLMAKKKPISSFLGDAENPAHTRWNTKAEKLKNYPNAPMTLTAIRNSLVQIHDLLAQAVETVTEGSLLDFFSRPKPGKNQQKRPKRRVSVEPEPPPPIPKPIRVAQTTDGFKLLPGESIQTDVMPLNAKILVAYNRPDGNVFRKYNPLDFDLGSAPISIESTNITVISAKNQELEIQIDNEDFELIVEGFDKNREPVVKVRS